MEFCKHCGARLLPGADHCTVCGAPCGQPADTTPEPLPPVPAAQPAPAEPVPPVQEPGHPGGEGAPSPCYCREPESHADQPSVWWYFGMLLLFAVPVIGLVAMLCFSFLPGCSKAQHNLARACLLLALLLAAVIAIGILLATLLLGSWQRAILYSYYGLY